MIKPAEIQVRFRDCDLMGHVNNAVYLSYFEQARMHFFEQLIGADWDYKKDGILLVKNELTYLKPVLLHDIPKIKLHLIELGNKSVSLGYTLYVEDELRCTGSSKFVCFDFTTQKTVEVFPKMREEFGKLEKI
jgi:acyl-CoA thioester hydrolase